MTIASRRVLEDPLLRTNPLSVRLAARARTLRSQTAGLAAGYLQGNLIAIPSGLAADFHRFCDLNRKPCPLLAVAGPGDPHLPTLGSDIDIRTDIPRYRVWRDGVIVDELLDVTDLWHDDLVAFILGCSFSFEEALAAEGLTPKHVVAGTNVPMYRTNISCTPAGPFSGPLVVSMRPYRPHDAIRVREITSQFPLAHGAPVHVGDPQRIGIQDLARPDYGEPIEVASDEIPLFWACGVTPQAVIEHARLPFAITHAPGCMLVTDILSAECSSAVS